MCHFISYTKSHCGLLLLANLVIQGYHVYWMHAPIGKVVYHEQEKLGTVAILVQW